MNISYSLTQSIRVFSSRLMPKCYGLSLISVRFSTRTCLIFSTNSSLIYCGGEKKSGMTDIAFLKSHLLLWGSRELPNAFAIWSIDYSLYEFWRWTAYLACYIFDMKLSMLRFMLPSALAIASLTFSAVCVIDYLVFFALNNDISLYRYFASRYLPGSSAPFMTTFALPSIMK